MAEKLENASTSGGGARSPRGGASAGGRARTARGGVPLPWVRFLRAHARITAQMDANLRAAHGVSLREYEILLALAEAAERRLRRVDLAASVLITQSGITRTLEPLERRGLVGRERSAEDRRVTFATLSPDGQALVRKAARTHTADIRTLFADRYSADELATLDTLLNRLPGAGDDEEWAVR
jgi:DNA-binding MarR family transcriptional regulator